MWGTLAPSSSVSRAHHLAPAEPPILLSPPAPSFLALLRPPVSAQFAAAAAVSVFMVLWRYLKLKESEVTDCLQGHSVLLGLKKLYIWVSAPSVALAGGGLRET